MQYNEVRVRKIMEQREKGIIFEIFHLTTVLHINFVCSLTFHFHNLCMVDFFLIDPNQIDTLLGPERKVRNNYELLYSKVMNE